MLQAGLWPPSPSRQSTQVSYWSQPSSSWSQESLLQPASQRRMTMLMEERSPQKIVPRRLTWEERTQQKLDEIARIQQQNAEHARRLDQARLFVERTFDEMSRQADEQKRALDAQLELRARVKAAEERRLSLENTLMRQRMGAAAMDAHMTGLDIERRTLQERRRQEQEAATRARAMQESMARLQSENAAYSHRKAKAEAEASGEQTHNTHPQSPEHNSQHSFDTDRAPPPQCGLSG